MSLFHGQKVNLRILLLVVFIPRYSWFAVESFSVNHRTNNYNSHNKNTIVNIELQGVLLPAPGHGYYSTRIPQLSSTSSILVDTDDTTYHDDHHPKNTHKNTNLLDLEKYTNVNEFNHVLNDLANQCFDDTPNQQKDVISLATLAEALVLKVEQYPPPPRIDVSFLQLNWMSYHTLIKVWTRVAQCLSEGRGRGNVLETFHSEDSIPPEFIRHGGIYSARDALVRATSILHGLELKYTKGQSSFGSELDGYHTILEAWSKCACKDAGERCEELLDKLHSLNLKTKTTKLDHTSSDITATTTTNTMKSIKPNAYTYALCIDALIHEEETEDTLGKIISLEQRLELEYNTTSDLSMKPKISTIGNKIIHAYGKSNFLITSNKEKQQQQQQGMMEDSSEETNFRSNAIPWTAARKAHEVFSIWYKRYKNTGDEDYRPDSMSFTYVLDAYARCGDKSSIDKAQQLFDFMIKEWKESGDDKLKPISRTFTSLVTAWSKSVDPSAPQKAEALLQMMEDLYNHDVEKGLKSLLTPNIRTYTAAISTWGNSKDPSKPQRAIRILKKCIDEYKKNGNEDMKPNLYTYNCCISACAKIDGAATFEQKSQALKTAFSLNKAIAAASMEANHFTYATLLKVVTSLMATGPERDEVAEALFVKCSKTGYVDLGVFKNLRLAASNSLYHRLLHNVTDKNGALNMDDIPKEWSRKVHAINNNG